MTPHPELWVEDLSNDASAKSEPQDTQRSHADAPVEVSTEGRNEGDFEPENVLLNWILMTALVGAVFALGLVFAPQ